MRGSSRKAPTPAITRPFLRWAGGKQHLVKQLLHFLPSDVGKRVCHEPFLGAGSLFFALRPARATLGDSNEHLIRCYEYVRDAPNLVARYLRWHARHTGEEHYYRVRREYNRSKFSSAQAARFIYLNKASFNGIFRVNQRGEYNVPYGHKEPPALPSRERLQRVSEMLAGARLQCADFEEAMQDCSAGDFVYVDPPYPALNGTSYFTHYTKDRFSDADQKRLAEVISDLHSRGCLVMVSNADTPWVRSLYHSFYKQTIPVRRYITCRPVKHTVRELIITNYEVPTC